MNLLALDTSTEQMSVCVARDDGNGARLWQFSGAGGAQASNSLIPTIMELLTQAQLSLTQLDAICFGSGPGSFTGLRTACAVAQGLSLGSGVPVLPVNSLLAVAECARAEIAARSGFSGPDGLTICAMLDARMNELYVATFQYRCEDQSGIATGLWTTLEEPELLSPVAVAEYTRAHHAPFLAGTGLELVIKPQPSECDWFPELVPATPDATALLRLAPQLLHAGLAVPADHALPTYVRDKVAQTTAERTAIKAAMAASAAST